MKMVGTGNGGWDVPWSSFEWQMEQMKRGRGIMVFDDGWHKLTTALWLFGPIREVRAWIGNLAVGPGIDLDAPTTIVWEHENGVRGVWDITIAMDMYLRSDYYTNDERWEITGSKGFARVNRCTGRGIQQPSLEVYADGEMRGYHALDDDWASSFRDSGRHWLRWLRTGEGPLLWSGEEAVDVLRFALAAYASSAAGGTGVDPRQLTWLPAADGDRDARVAARAVRLRRLLQGGLGVTGGVGGPRLDHVVAGRRVPVPHPLPPAVDVGHGGQPGLVPRAAVHPDLDRVDALVLGPGDPGDRRGPRRQLPGAGRARRSATRS